MSSGQRERGMMSDLSGWARGGDKERNLSNRIDDRYPYTSPTRLGIDEITLKTE